MNPKTVRSCLKRILRTALPACFLAAGGTVFFVLLFSALLAFGVPDGWIACFTCLSVLLGSVLGGWFAGLRSGEQGLAVGLATGLCLFLLHGLVTLCVGGVSLSLLGFFAAETLGGMLGGILGVNTRRP